MLAMTTAELLVNDYCEHLLFCLHILLSNSKYSSVTPLHHK